MGAAQLPSRYLMQALTQFAGPLTFPDHGAVMDVRQAKHRCGAFGFGKPVCGGPGAKAAPPAAPVRAVQRPS
jgi:hypothetical protein